MFDRNGVSSAVGVKVVERGGKVRMRKPKCLNLFEHVEGMKDVKLIEICRIKVDMVREEGEGRAGPKI